MYVYLVAVFVFDLYDHNADGVLRRTQLQDLFRELLGTKQLVSNTAKS